MFRQASSQDLLSLHDLERDANLVALGHVFPPERYPFPGVAVLARWRLVLEDPSVTVLVVDDPQGADLLAYTAFDHTSLRHLAVRPDHWGTGLATQAIEEALQGMGLRGSVEASLWCLEENHRARRLYEHLGWRPTGDRQPAAWPPHPTEMRYARSIVSSER